jgi:hypothetical protein
MVFAAIISRRFSTLFFGEPENNRRIPGYTYEGRTWGNASILSSQTQTQLLLISPPSFAPTVDKVKEVEINIS